MTEEEAAQVQRGHDSSKRDHTTILLDIFGNPFRPARINRDWMTPEVVMLARAIYDCREFERMPQLVDMLERAGCDGSDFLSHCRSPEEHARGCWVLDAILDMN